MKILILVLSYDDNAIYSKLMQTQKETWDSIEVDNVQTYYLLGNNDKNELINNHIYTSNSESIGNCGYKTIDSFEQIINMDFDYIFRTNSSSYVDKSLLKKFLIDKPIENFYCGIIGFDSTTQIEFCSGSGFFLSRNLVQLLIDNKHELDYSLIDDVCIGKFMKSKNIIFTNSFRTDIVSSDEPHLDSFHYRLKTENRNEDINRMKKIFNSKCNILQETSLN